MESTPPDTGAEDCPTSYPAPTFDVPDENEEEVLDRNEDDNGTHDDQIRYETEEDQESGGKPTEYVVPDDPGYNMEEVLWPPTLTPCFVRPLDTRGLSDPVYDADAWANRSRSPSAKRFEQAARGSSAPSQPEITLGWATSLIRTNKLQQASTLEPRTTLVR